jgi:hypothetical protein
MKDPKLTEKHAGEKSKDDVLDSAQANVTENS